MTTSLESLQQRLEYRFKNFSFLHQAITHKSFHYENLETSLGHNERLEFLGDAVLDLAIGAMLMRKYPEDDEGVLSRKRAFLVNERGLAEVALQLEMGQVLLLGRGESEARGALKPSILSSAFEAVLGAVFLDGGFSACEPIIRSLFEARVAQVSVETVHDHKSKLQELLQERDKTIPYYKVLDSSGPDHEKKFEIGVFAGETLLAQASGKSKKMAEQEAAKQALLAIKENNCE